MWIDFHGKKLVKILKRVLTGTMRGKGVTDPGTIAKDPIFVHGMWFDGILLTDRRTVAGVVLGSISSKREFAASVGLDEPFFAAWVIREKQRCSIHRLSDSSGARRQDNCCGIPPEGKFTRESQFECYAIGCHWVIRERTFKAGQAVKRGQLVRIKRRHGIATNCKESNFS